MSAIIVVMTLLVQQGCVTVREGERMRSDLADIRARIDQIDKRDKGTREQIAQLQVILEQAARLLARNAADFGVREARTEAAIAELQSRVDQFTHAVDAGSQAESEAEKRMDGRLVALERSEAMIVDRVAPATPEDKDQLWQQAEERLRRGQRDEGRRFFRVYIQRFPADPRASQAYLAIGRSFAEETQFSKAAAEFQKLLEVYPRAPEVPEAIWRLSLAFVELRFCSDARALLGDLVKRYPKSAAAREAQKEIRTLTKLPRSACTS